VASLVITSCFVAPTGIYAQTPPPRPANPATPAPDPAYEASKAAFDGWPEADRKAIQDALVWASSYHGVVDGTFGKGTREALIAFETHEKLHADGIVDAGEMARLALAAKKAKEAVRFTVVADPVSGIRLGLPLKSLVKRQAGRSGTKYASADGTVTVETQLIQNEADPGKLYDKLKADGPDRKVTYKATKGDWFVVSGETGDAHFYTRYAKGTAADGDELRGYTFTYPADSVEFDRISVAIANSFEPFPGTTSVAAANPGDTPVRKTDPGAPATPPVPVTPPTPPKSRFSATGVVVGSGRIVTVLPAACTDPSTGKQKLSVVASDANSGLTLLDAGQARTASLAFGSGDVANGTPLLVVAYVAGKAAPSLEVAPGEALVRPETLRILAPLQEDSDGGAVFDRSGGLRGIVGRETQKPRLVAGIVPLASHGVIGLPELSAFLGANHVDVAPAASASQTLTAADIAAAARPGLVPVDCVR
jgi:peptidoglycan hydrolase-like protein with peptidoglycan-binding domain